ncbi:MAG: hypothetical protein WCH57_10240 [Verrucomicrobiota bacterium]
MQKLFKYLLAVMVIGSTSILTAYEASGASAELSTPSDGNTVESSTQTTPTPSPAKQPTLEGVFYVLERISKATDSGIVSLTPGTKVLLVHTGTPMVITDGQQQYQAYSYQLTKNPDLGEKLAREEHSKQAKFEQAVLQTTQERQKQEYLAKKTIRENIKTIIERQQKIIKIQQQIKDVRRDIFENTPNSLTQPPLFPDAWRNPGPLQLFLADKKKELRHLEEELEKLCGYATFN